MKGENSEWDLIFNPLLLLNYLKNFLLSCALFFPLTFPTCPLPLHFLTLSNPCTLHPQVEALLKCSVSMVSMSALLSQS